MLTTCARPAEAQTSTLTSGNSTVVIDPHSTDGVEGWIVDGVPQLAQQWYWLRLGSSGPEVPLNSLGPPLVTGGGSAVRFDFAGAVASVLLQVDLTYQLAGGGPGSGQSQLHEEITIRAPLERSDVVVHVFRYADLNLVGTSAGDRAEWLSPATIRQSEGQTAAEALGAPTPTHFQLAFPPAILTSLADGGATTLSDSPTSLGPGNLTFAVQWDLPLPTRGTATANHTTRISPPAATDLSVTKTDGQAAAVPGTPITYTIVARNGGPEPVTGATVVDVVPAAIADTTWDCVGAGGGTCTAHGSGHINDTVDLPVNGTATYTLTGTIHALARGSLGNTATVAAPAGVTDPDPANNSATDTDVLPGVDYFTLAPCRVVDTRGGAPIGGPALQGQQTRVFSMAGHCGIPSTARALSVNLTVTASTAMGNVRLFPAGVPPPTSSSINYAAGQTRANNALVALDLSGQLAAFVGQPAGTTVHLIIDVNGYLE